MLDRLKTQYLLHLRLSIGARLALSFAAVAVLAGVANFLARESVAIIYVPRPDNAVAAPRPAPVVSEPVRPMVTVPVVVDTSRLLSALDGVERSARTRAAGGPSIPDAEFQLARQALLHAPEAGSAVIAPRVSSFLLEAQRLMETADARRVSRGKYPGYLQAMTQRMQASMDSTFKIFGRVLARQSLLDLRAELDVLRQKSEEALSGDSIESDRLTPLLNAERAFGDTLASNRSRFAKTEGPDWVASMQKDFDGLLVTRTELQALDRAYIERERRFSQQRGLLAGAIGSLARARTIQTAQANVGVVRMVAASESLAAPPAPAAAFTPIPPVGAGPADRHALQLMAEVTMVVMLVVTLISIATVRSVTLPVRNLLKAARDLAAGGSNIRVPRGGNRELDTLAGEFNDMSRQLDEARRLSHHHQDELEAKILERTHKLQKLVEQDSLTLLPNRRRMLSLLSDALKNAESAGLRVGVYFLDLDNFKNFNDSLGHDFGDRVLMSVANRLEELMEGDGFVARLGGDEFTIVYEKARSEHDVRAMGAKLLDAFRELTSVDDRDLSVSVSIGASFSPDHGSAPDELLRAADAALFRAKELGRRQLALFSPELIASASRRFEIEQNLRLALERDEFELVYQPEVNMATLEVELVEALLRWRQPDGRLVAPGEFLAVAEQTGLIVQISDFVLRTAVRDAAEWHHHGWPDAKVAINVSARQLLDPHFTERLVALLHEHRLPAAAVEIELTETVLQTSATTISALQDLRAHGFGVALDDFGTGFSSLTSLEQLPLTRIKLDRSLIVDVESSPRSAAIARAIIALCRGLKLELTAEGIERQGQLQWLQGNGAMMIQGYLFSRPVPPETLLAVRTQVAGLARELVLTFDALPPSTRPIADEADLALSA